MTRKLSEPTEKLLEILKNQPGKSGIEYQNIFNKLHASLQLKCDSTLSNLYKAGYIGRVPNPQGRGYLYGIGQKNSTVQVTPHLKQLPAKSFILVTNTCTIVHSSENIDDIAKQAQVIRACNGECIVYESTNL